jgi:hypothetical protein
VEAVARMPVAD